MCIDGAYLTGVFPRGVGQVMKVRKQIIAYVAGQLAACTEADPAHPDKPFKVITQHLEAPAVVRRSRSVGDANASACMLL